MNTQAKYRVEHDEDALASYVYVGDPEKRFLAEFSWTVCGIPKEQMMEAAEVFNKVARLESVNTELLASLEEAIGILDEMSNVTRAGWNASYEVKNKARAAIEKAKKK